MQGRVEEGAVHARSFDAGGVENGDDVAGGGALEILVAAGVGVEKKTASDVGEKCVGLDFGIDRLGEDVTEGEAENVGAEVVDIGYGADVVGERAFGIEVGLGSALVDA